MKIWGLTVLIMACSYINAQEDIEIIKHAVYSNRLLFRSSQYLHSKNMNIETNSNHYMKIFPRFGEYFHINLKKIDTISLGKYQIYEYQIKNRCFSSRDNETNETLRSEPELHFLDSVFQPCECCNSTGDIFSETIPSMSDCTNTKGILAVEYPNSVTLPIVYFISGNCVLLDDFEKLFFLENPQTDENLFKLIQLKFWNTDINKDGTMVSGIQKIKQNKYKIYLNENKLQYILKIKKNNVIKLR